MMMKRKGEGEQGDVGTRDVPRLFAGVKPENFYRFPGDLDDNRRFSLGILFFPPERLVL